ncbi:MAG: PQQ-dependent sugar dehydrogenase [Runella sp.]
MLKLFSFGAVGAALLLMYETSTPPHKEAMLSLNNAAQKNYQTYCASCHGEKVEMFVDRKWKYGQTKANLIKSISAGYPDNGMPSWSAALKPKEIEAMADYLLEAIKKGSKYEFAEKPRSNVFPSSEMTVKLDTIASGLNNPWGIAFLPNGDLLITDRSGEVYRVDKNRKKTKLEGVPAVVAEGQGGMLDVEIHPKFAENSYIYLSYSLGKTENGQKLATTAVMRAKLDGNKLTDQKVIFEAQPYLRTRHHYGSRLEFDKNGYLFVSVGDRGQHIPQFPQSLDNDCGKIHRLNDDGSIPDDNPFVKTDKARGSIYSYGHRNPQGMFIHPTTGEIWEHEHGPRGGDELNLVSKAVNYGWPVISYGINYDGTILTPLTAKEGLQQPNHYWIPSIGPSGMTVVTGDRYGAWKGDFLIGSLRFKYLNRCKVQNGKVVKEEILLQNLGRMRAVEMSPDGYIYVGVEEPGFVFKLVPMPVK